MDDLTTLVSAAVMAVVYVVMIYLLVAKRTVLMVKVLEFEQWAKNQGDSQDYRNFRDRWFKWLK